MSFLKRLRSKKQEIDGIPVVKADAADKPAGNIVIGQEWPKVRQTIYLPRVMSDAEWSRYYRSLPTPEIWDAMTREEQQAVDEAQPHNPMIAELKARKAK